MRVSFIAAALCLAAGPALAQGAAENPAPAAPANEQRLRDLQLRVGQLREDVTAQRARLGLLGEGLFGDGVGGARAVISVENAMGPGYRLVRATVTLDGAVVAVRADDRGSLADARAVPVFNGQVRPGDHVLVVSLEYRGVGYGLFPYAEGYTLRVRSSQTFAAPEGRGVFLRVVGYQRGDVTLPVAERPAVIFQQRAAPLRDAVDAAPSTEPAAPPAR